eukprot:gene2373-3680_t
MNRIRSSCAVRSTSHRRCSSHVQALLQEQKQQLEYWKTSAHYYQERMEAQQQFMGQCARLSEGFKEVGRDWECWDVDARKPAPPKGSADPGDKEDDGVATITYQQFFEEYSRLSRPLLLKELAPHPSDWASLDFWREQFGSEDARESTGTAFAFNPACERGLEVMEADANVSDCLSKYARRVQYPSSTPDDWAASAGAMKESRLVTSEVSLPGAAPFLLESFAVPGFFAQDLLQYARQSQALRRSQVDERERLEAENPRAALPAIWAEGVLHLINGDPMLRLSPRGSQSSLHSVPGSLHMWLHVTSGVQEWMIFPQDFTPALYDQSAHTFALDAFEPDFDAFPSAIMAYPWRVTLRAGDTLFVPADTAFQWRCTEDSISTIMTFVDWANVETATYDAERLASCGNPAMQELVKGF